MYEGAKDYERGYSDAIKRFEDIRRERKLEKSLRRRALMIQRLWGLALVLFSVLAVVVLTLNGDESSIALFFGPIGLYLLFTKKILIKEDDYHG